MTYSNILELQFDLDEAAIAREEEDTATPEQVEALGLLICPTRTPEQVAAWDAALKNLEAMFAPKAVR